jgi:transcriptional regulator with XRE-family HTH domain
MSFGQHLRHLRDAAGLPRAELARRAAVPASTLRGWENDQGFPGVRPYLRLVAALGVTPERLAEGVEDPAEDGPAAPAEEASKKPPTDLVPPPAAPVACASRREGREGDCAASAARAGAVAQGELWDGRAGGEPVRGVRPDGRGDSPAAGPRRLGVRHGVRRGAAPGHNPTITHPTCVAGAKATSGP